MSLRAIISRLGRPAGLALLLAGGLTAATPALGQFAYKSYVVKQDNGREILCDPYRVKKNDWVLKIFRLKGDIAQSDFPKFLGLFRRLNPHVRNINTIRPGQHILIPLKELASGLLAEEPDDGVVNVPFLSLSGAVDPPSPQPKDTVVDGAYRVRKGDCVSRLVATRFGDYGTDFYWQGLRLFRQANPTIRNLEQIYVGQWINLPRVGPIPASPPAAKPDFEPVQTGFALYQSSRQTETPAPEKISALERIASLLEARMLTRGQFFFPRTGAEDLAVDMGDLPVMTLPDGRRLLFHTPDRGQDPVLAAVRKHWKNARTVSLTPGADTAQVMDAVSRALGGREGDRAIDLSADGVRIHVQARWVFDMPPVAGDGPGRLCITMIDDPDQRTPPPLTRYLARYQVVIRDVLRISRPEGGGGGTVSRPKPPPTRLVSTDARSFVRDLLKAMGYAYAEKVNISFPYAGIQVAAVSNLMTTPDGNPLFVDFEDLFGDAVASIRRSGFNIIQVRSGDSLGAIVKKIVRAANAEFTENPTILAADRPAKFNTAVTIPGILVRPSASEGMLLTGVSLHPAMSDFLREKGIRIILLPATGGDGADTKRA
jgi:hypothetical protein